MTLLKFPLPEQESSRSLSKEFTEQLTKLKCNNKDDDGRHCAKTFSKSNLPGIACCGHLACISHKKSFPNFDFNAVMDFHCVEDHPPGSYLGSNDYMEDKLLEEFFKVIAKGGVKCHACSEVHPQHNAVLYHDDKKELKFVCVWCAAKPEEYLNCDLELIQNNVYVTNISKRDDNTIVLAQSVNRNEEDVGWAMGMCCVCQKDMFTDGHKLVLASLSCKHLCEYKCVENPNVKCKICKTNNRLKELKKIESKHLGYPSMGEMECCEGCNLKHPKSNRAIMELEADFTILRKKHWCVWCKVEQKITDRRNRKEGKK